METYNQEKIFEILSKKSEDKFIQIQRILSKMDSHEIAHCLESTPSEQRKVIWSIIDKSNEADVLSELGEEIQQDLFDEISNEELLDLVQNLELDEMVDILQNLPQQRISFLLSKMTKIDRERVEMVLEPELKVSDIMNDKPHSFMVNESDKEVSKFFEQNDLISAAVVNHKNELIGRITIDDVVDVIIEDADQNFLSMAGIAEDTFSPPARAARRRIVWLGLNLITAFVAALAINIFQDAIDKIVYLAVLMPIVASMGGVAATQTLTIVLRGLTLEQISSSNLGWLFKRELAVAILNGIILSLIISLVTYVWFNELILSTLIAAAMIINLLSSVVAGVFVPIILRRLNQDPAIAGSVIVTTVTDVVGFVSFLGLATIFLL